MGKRASSTQPFTTVFTVDGSGLRQLAPVLKQGVGKIVKYLPERVGVLKPILFGYLQKILDQSNIILSKQGGLTEIQAKERNDQAYQELSILFDRVNNAIAILEDSPEAVRGLNAKLDNIQKAINTYGQMYQAVYHTAPPRPMLPEKKEYDPAELSKMYVDYVVKMSVAVPSQSELAKHYGMGQSTWSRRHDEPEFWKMIQDDIDLTLNRLEEKKNMLFHLDKIAEKKESDLRFQQRKDKEQPYDPQVLENTVDAKEEEDAQFRGSDSKLTMSDLEEDLNEKRIDELVPIAQKLAPKFDPSRLQMMTKKQLIICIVALSYR